MKMSRVIAFSNAFEVDRKLELSISMDLLCRNTHWKTFDDINGLHFNIYFLFILKTDIKIKVINT